MRHIQRLKSIARRDRGSALLVSLMVIVGLSLLGLGFVALSETESAIAKNQQADLQTQAIAEAGAKLVVEWFQNPTAALNAGCPSNTSANINNIKITRTSGGYSGKYKSQSSQLLFDKPFRPDPNDRFYGAESNPDFQINTTTDQTSLDAFNAALLGTGTYDKSSGEVIEVDVYAPPMTASTLTSDGGNPAKYFYVGGQRFGVATIKVVAAQFRDPTLAADATHKYAPANILAEHTVRLVVGELPLPIPAGPVQGNANVSFGGNFRVHWGMETAEGTLTPSLNLQSLPWANAYERPHFEHGYESGSGVNAIVVTAGGTGYSSAPAVGLAPGGGNTGAGFTATANVTNGQVTSVTINTPGSGYTSAPPDWAPLVTFTGGGGTGASAIASVGTELWPIVPTQRFEDANYFNELIDKSYDDPWYGARAKGDNMADGTTPANTNFQCFTYAYSANETSNASPSYAFQWQDTNSFPLQRLVTFPIIRYAFWKRITQQGRGYKGMYYFSYDSGSGNFLKFGAGSPQPVAYWANTQNGANLGPGVYFFDTTNGGDPQTASGGTNTTILTPALSWNSNDFNHGMLMQGFIYLNAVSFGTTGQGSSAVTVQANFPGEPYRDIGYPIWCTGAGQATGATLPDQQTPTNNCPAGNQWATCGTGICRGGAGDGVFSYQDLNGNGRFDCVVRQKANSFVSYDPSATSHNAGQWVVKTWKSHTMAVNDYGGDCTVPAATYNGTNPASNDCSEPHEPFLNLIYPTTAADNNGAPTPVVAGWEAPTSQTRRPKVLDSSGNPVGCNSTSPQSQCTSNAYDVDGGIVPLSVILDGILYNEGNYDASGNTWYYGSLLIRGTIGSGGGGANGTADIWFDEKLLKGSWAPPNMPRVIVFNEGTDEMAQ